MNYIYTFLLLSTLLSCDQSEYSKTDPPKSQQPLKNEKVKHYPSDIKNGENGHFSQQSLKNEKIRNHSFLKGMYEDPYFPDFLVDKAKELLIELCAQIEEQNPQNAKELYVLTHIATEKFNDLQNVFDEHDSEIETYARESIASDFDFIAKAYGFANADGEELIAPREW